ncbi:hypothetical protein E4631_23090 [Hymenobacter sp. UV11]|uniref:hypothetical protein n=1 Tax=Hymenobacter sp. UV11 TaxID=1849735 RepID=UPI00105E99FF|nr:hypothetical protein [Hymenobacter sp. UV11]TDN39630.1 hypothetical protein A8B98_18255 [Hymenobacter sp. UV11]TFZ63378.1 hypothetical protein E4631_23090 [Hymenobacter sp. UV11]
MKLFNNRSGNFNAAQRSAVLQVCVVVLGRKRIGLVLDDREFGSHTWVKGLKDSGLNFVIRSHQHQLLPDAHDQCQAVADLGLAVGQVCHLAQR